MIYETSELSLDELRAETSKWSYEEKNRVFESYISEHQKIGKALETANYSFDIVCNYSVFREFLNQKTANNLIWQDLTPRYGYEIPQIIEDADLVDKYQECFDLSLKLYSQMKLKNYDKQAQYVTLFGHRMRLQISYNAKDANVVLKPTNEDLAEYNHIVDQMHEKMSEVHPLVIGSLNLKSDIEQEFKTSTGRVVKRKSKKTI
jgi:hypothetical protein